MVALTAVLGPRDAPGTYNWQPALDQPVIAVPIPIRPGYDVFVSAAPDTASAGTNLGTFEHNSGTDIAYTLNHAVVDHIRSLLYPREQKTPANTTPPSIGWVNPGTYPDGQPKYTGPTPGTMFPLNFNDLQIIRIKRFGPVMTATSLTAAPVTMAVAGTATLAPKLQPGDVVSAPADNILVSNAPSIATVSAAGVVTGVSPGTTQIKITHKSNGLMAEAQVTVTGAGVFLSGTESQAVVDKDGKRSYVPYDEPEAEEKTVEGDPKAQGFVLNKADGGDTSGEPDEITEAEAAEASIQGEDGDKIVDEAAEEEVSVGEIAGIGPATEAKLAEVGITTARQIAELSEEDADKLDDELGLGGRIRRDDWVAQAKELIA
jgi:predicted flap endonuclease-1-like 5' DNA nuclease